MMIFILFLLLAAYITAVICYPHETVIFTVIATMIFSTIFLVGGIINCCDKPCKSNIHFNKKVEVDENLETKVEGLYALGDGSGVTHSLSQASASGVHVARILTEKYNGKEAK